MTSQTYHASSYLHAGGIRYFDHSSTSARTLAAHGLTEHRPISDDFAEIWDLYDVPDTPTSHPSAGGDSNNTPTTSPQPSAVTVALDRDVPVHDSNLHVVPTTHVDDTNAQSSRLALAVAEPQDREDTSFLTSSTDMVTTDAIHNSHQMEIGSVTQMQFESSPPIYFESQTAVRGSSEVPETPNIIFTHGEAMDAEHDEGIRVRGSRGRIRKGQSSNSRFVPYERPMTRARAAALLSFNPSESLSPSTRSTTEMSTPYADHAQGAVYEPTCDAMDQDAITSDNSTLPLTSDKGTAEQTSPPSARTSRLIPCKLVHPETQVVCGKEIAGDDEAAINAHIKYHLKSEFGILPAAIPTAIETRRGKKAPKAGKPQKVKLIYVLCTWEDCPCRGKPMQLQSWKRHVKTSRSHFSFGFVCPICEDAGDRPAQRKDAVIRHVNGTHIKKGELLEEGWKERLKPVNAA
ncbi:hypothetical protein OBBRIDRAFT_661405 [Obba rivulosa]|uniref:Uncharacterized protein n=1 Tax=Obba rivulosa TaxID=1052685 RepID=A0A8E2ASD3_9APHY|nr:hypothetical protein OBBRIDRAFT_661405 [Obba rivulosa]